MSKDEAPSRDAMQEKLEEAINIKEGLEDFYEKADAYDKDYEYNHPAERPLRLDELPFGEEVIRAKQSIEALDDAIEELQELIEADSHSEEDIEEYDQLLEEISLAEGDLEEFSDAPALNPQEQQYEDEDLDEDLDEEEEVEDF